METAPPELPEPVLEVRFEQSEVDLWAFQRYHLPRHPQVFAPMAIMFVLIAVLMQLLVHSRSGRLTGLTSSVAVITPLVYLVVIAVMFVSRTRQQVRQAGFIGPRRVTLSARGVRAETISGSIERDWTGVLRIEETPALVLVYIGAQHALLVPRRAFASPEELARFVMTARTLRNSAVTRPASTELETSPPSAGMVAECDVTERDLWEVQMHRLLQPAGIIRLLLAAMIFAGEGAWLWRLPGFVGGLLVVPLFGLWIVPLLERRRWLSLMAGGGRYRITISPAGITTRNPAGEGTTAWANIVRIEASRSHFLFSNFTGTPLVIPRRAFISGEQAEAFLASAQLWHSTAPGIARRLA